MYMYIHVHCMLVCVLVSLYQLSTTQIQIICFLSLVIVRAFWGYHSLYPTVADKLFDSLDSNVQKHLRDEKTAMNGGTKGGGGPVRPSQVK